MDAYQFLIAASANAQNVKLQWFETWREAHDPSNPPHIATKAEECLVKASAEADLITQSVLNAAGSAAQLIADSTDAND